MAALRQVGSQPYVELMSWRNALVALEAEAIPVGAQLDRVYLDLYTHLDDFVVRSGKVPAQLRPPNVGLLGLQVAADVDSQMELDVIHTAAVAKIGRLEILDEAGHASTSLTLASNLGRPAPRLPTTSTPPTTNGTYRDPEATRRRMTDAADVRLTKLDTQGDEAWRDAVAAHFRNHLEEVKIDYYWCGLRDDPKLAGELSLDVAVGTRGQVFIVHVASHSESLSREFIDCLTGRIWVSHIYRYGESVVVAHLSLRLQPKKS